MRAKTDYTLLSCQWEGCSSNRNKYGGKMCWMHQSRLRKGQDMDAPRKREKGTGTVNKNGYVVLYLPEHPNAQKHGYVLEHTVVMSEALGRPLTSDENVHHKNGVRHDNRLENLELWSTHQPKGQKVSDLLEWAKEIIERYDCE